ncbi:gamma-glutamyltransferase [Dermacoccaceae bacterium W4C1]
MPQQSPEAEPSRRVAIAAPNALAAQAGVDVVALGGNAVDAALAAMALTFVSEPGIVSAMGGAFINIWPAHGAPVVVDGNAEMPGRGLPADRFGGGVKDIWLNYAGGMTIQGGAGSVATPGAFAAMEEAYRRYGSGEWSQVLMPAADVAARGWRIGAAAGSYLQQVGDGLFTFDPTTREALTRDGRVLGPGDPTRNPELASVLRRLAAEGTEPLYRGDLARQVAHCIQEGGGLLTEADLAQYQVQVRPADVTDIGRWQVAGNPPPSIGGPVLTAMLRLLAEHGGCDPVAIARVQQRVLSWRRDHIDTAQDLAVAGRELLDSLQQLSLEKVPRSSNTAHVSAVDSDGVACAITASAGYSSGVTVPGTGLLLNNSLGEPELNTHGLHAVPPGTRLASNMAPTTARHSDGSTLAIGSPGADRITTALQQTLARFLLTGQGLQESIDAPRMHLRLTEGDGVVCEHEPDDEIAAAAAELGLASNVHDPVAMYFGGVGGALAGPAGDLSAAGDPRRAAATAVG